MTESRGMLQLRAVLEPRGPAGAFVLTDEQVATLSAAKNPPVQVTINNRTVRARIGRMGGENLLGLSKRLRTEIGIEIGQCVDVVIALDSQPRTVEVPPALAEAFRQDTAAEAAFVALAPSHQKEFARWIDEAKRQETRSSRVAETLEMLREGRTRR